MSVCLFVSNKRQNGWTDWAQFFLGPWIFKNLPLTKFDFGKILKIHDLKKNSDISFVVFYDSYKDKMFTIKIEDEHEAP